MLSLSGARTAFGRVGSLLMRPSARGSVRQVHSGPSNANTTTQLSPPVAPVEPTTLANDRVDNYYYMRFREDPRVLEYIHAENAFTKAMTASYQELEKTLFQEFKGRLKETDSTVPYKKGDHLYYSRTIEGKQYRVYCRRPFPREQSLTPQDAASLSNGPSSGEEVLLDLNTIAESQKLDYLAVGALEVSPNGQLLAYSLDTDGSECYTLQVKDMTTGQMLGDVVKNTYSGCEWSSDNSHLFYTTLDETKRPYQVWRHRLGSSSSSDVCLVTEPDEHFFLHLYKSSSGKYLLISLDSKTKSQVSYLRADDPYGELQVFQPKTADLEYYVDHHDDGFYIVTNAFGAVNFQLMWTPELHTDMSSWKNVLPYKEGRRISGVKTFKDYIVLSTREDGNAKIFYRKVGEEKFQTVVLPETACSVRLSNNPNFDTKWLRLVYSSMVSPPSTFDFDMEKGELVLLKEEEVRGYNKDLYHTERQFSIARDGERIPVSIVYRKDKYRKDGTNPCLLYGYGSYGHSIDPSFNSMRISLLDRGFVFVIAHIRGGGENGRPWYYKGKFLHKKNTFTDFIDVAEWTLRQGITSKDRLVALGRSAGGLLMGAVVNMRPDLFVSVIADVPFVDVLTTMMDASIPLTVTEWEEWGNPSVPEFYDYMLSYSPVDNTVAQPYPHMLITGGLNDPRVQYWEPTKWTAKLRTLNTNPNSLILLKINMGAGHFGTSGRYEFLQEMAFEYAFILRSVGITQ